MLGSEKKFKKRSYYRSFYNPLEGFWLPRQICWYAAIPGCLWHFSNLLQLLFFFLTSPKFSESFNVGFSDTCSLYLLKFLITWFWWREWRAVTSLSSHQNLEVQYCFEIQLKRKYFRLCEAFKVTYLPYLFLICNFGCFLASANNA